MAIKDELIDLAKKAQGASRLAYGISSALKNKALREMACRLISAQEAILTANQKDLRRAQAGGKSSAFTDRLALSPERIRQMSDGLLEVAKLPDPVGEKLKCYSRPNGLKIEKVRVPIGVIAIIYESRPNVTADCIGLCFKSGNSVILRGGSEALQSNLAIFKVIKEVIKKMNLPEGLVNIVTAADRKAIDILLKLNDYIDLVMPRGGEGLIRHVVKASRIPVIKHYLGICHVYVDSKADLNMAQRICFNAKVQRPGTCNAMECMLVHQDAAARFLPGMIKEFSGAGVEIRGCPLTQKIAGRIHKSLVPKGRVKKAAERDYRSEYLDLILSVKVVPDLAEAIRHINYYGSHHSDSIVTNSSQNAAEFLKGVDSACVYVNASTRFTDGNQFGMGAEIGISTDKLHARGPVALEELTTYKYLIRGNGQVRQ
ncbi:MAG: glutamate-5-semialdehyde dehydrogenase [Candidatus Omnitrophota bacterium]